MAGGLREVPVGVSIAGDTVAVEPERVRIQSRGQEVVWSCADGELAVAFDKDGCPFDTSHHGARKNEHAHSGENRHGRHGDVFHYSVTVTTDDGRTLSRDPEVEVNDAAGMPMPGEGREQVVPERPTPRRKKSVQARKRKKAAPKRKRPARKTVRKRRPTRKAPRKRRPAGRKGARRRKPAVRRRKKK